MSEAPTSALRARCEDEVTDLHRFFGGWLRGEIDPEGGGLSRMSDVLAEGFHMISAAGEILGRSEIVAAVRAAHGSKPAGFAIRTEDCRFRLGSRRLGVVTYQEWHDEGGESRGRLSTAIFQDRADAPNGVEWVHVHETWIGRAGA
jgi:hypothetical protein